MAPAATNVPTTPPRVVGPATKKATRPTNQLPQSMIDEARMVRKEAFDPKVHLNYDPPRRIYTMKEIGLEGHGISPNAASEPFSLFTEEAIMQMRAEIFSEEALKGCQYTSNFIKNMVRGMGPALAPFIYNAWNHPEVVAKISEVAGVDLIPSIDFEIGNVNISFGDGTTATWNRTTDSEDGTSAVAWHYDSFPFVCVTMLSDCNGMVGGETALRRPDGHIMKVRGPAMGTAMVLQGRYIEHQALKAVGGRERISMVTSFRPRSPIIKDETVLTGVRGISDLSTLYSQYTDYRLELLEERLRLMLKEERRRQIANHPFDLPKVRKFLVEQKEFLDSMLEELIEVHD
ncbi:hypothetical protein BDV35DRAFT_388567 [Aspergillus flavus]|uniref:Fe2OG dioxygenase domain-containing protein n=1 Tax=Aspergillus flavus TaxID=5059 RepID=A0A5N6HAA5_ASPFL|nr:hypothetical protein BDV35DRAFT_388567 [Aspergillus flavus]RAQ69403.1 hypothetical protein COH20_006561 [Aspergillus flavus]RAQ71035.1 hypothetical protein COH21_006671 [Aspergillus flavus]